MATEIAPENESNVVELPIINTVTMINKTEETVEVDPFKSKATDLRVYKGIGSNEKRRISNQLKKARQNVAGTVGSARIDETLLTGYDAFGVATPPYNLFAFAQLYEMSPGHYAAVNAKTANIVGLGYNFTQSRATQRLLEENEGNEKKLDKLRKTLDQHRDDLIDMFENFNEEDTFVETLCKVWRDYEVTGNGYLEVGRNQDGTIGYVGHVPSPTVRIRKDRDGFVQIVNGRVQFFRNYGDTSGHNPINSENEPNELLHIKKYSPTNTYYGIPDIIAAQQAVAGNEYSSKYNLDFFENKAVPRYVITLKGARLGPRAESDLLTFFETGLKGQNHRSIFIPLPPDQGDNKVEFKMEPVENKVQEASFSSYRKDNLNEILMAHRVPITKVSIASAASVAVAQDADKTFKEQVCAPEQKILEKKLNRLVKELTDAFELKLNEMTLTDELTRAKINDMYLKDGVLLRNEVRTELGKATIDKGDEIIDMNNKSTGQTASNQLSEASANRQRDTQRAVSGTDSNGAGRNPKGEGRTEGTA